MTCDQFVSNLRGVDDGGDFPPRVLRDMFDDIKRRSIEWKDEAPTAGDAAPGAETKRNNRIKGRVWRE